MPSDRVMYEFPDGNREARQPPTLPLLGERLLRRGKDWVVTDFEDRGEVMVVKLHRAVNTIEPR